MAQFDFLFRETILDKVKRRAAIARGDILPSGQKTSNPALNTFVSPSYTRQGIQYTGGVYTPVPSTGSTTFNQPSFSYSSTIVTTSGGGTQGTVSSPFGATTTTQGTTLRTTTTSGSSEDYLLGQQRPEANRLATSGDATILELKPSGPPSPTWADEDNFNALRELTGNDDLALNNYWLPSVQQGLFPRTAFAAIGSPSFPVYNGEQGLLFDLSDLPDTGLGGEGRSFLAATADLTRNKKSLNTVTLEAEILHNLHPESGSITTSSSSSFIATVVPRDGNQIFTKSALRIITEATTPSQFSPTRQYTVYVELNPMYTNFGFSTNTIFAADFEPGSWFSIKCILRKPLVEDPLNTFCTIVFNGQSFEIPYYLTDIPSERVREDMPKLFTLPEHYFAIRGGGGRNYPLIPGAGPLPANFSVRNLKYTFT